MTRRHQGIFQLKLKNNQRTSDNEFYSKLRYSIRFRVLDNSIIQNKGYFCNIRAVDDYPLRNGAASYDSLCDFFERYYLRANKPI